MSDFGTRLVATYLGSWPGCSWHGRRQDCTGGPPFAFRVPPFFSSCCEVSLAPGCGNHAHARACAATATSHAWAPTQLHEDTGGDTRKYSKYIYIPMIYTIMPPVIPVNYDSACIQNCLFFY